MLTTDELEELSRLRRENRQLKVERDILGKSRGLVCAGVGDDPTRCLAFVSANQALAPIATICRVFGVAESGYHARRARTPSPHTPRDAEIRVEIRTAQARSHGTYGATRILEDLRKAGYRVGRKRVARLMRVEGMSGVSKRRGLARPRRLAPESPLAPDLVSRDFRATAPNQL